jgi:hypothetical protein
MRETRRKFLVIFGAAAAWLSASKVLLFAQRPIYPPPPPEPGETHVPGASASPAERDAARRALLRQHEKEFREGVQRLYELTSELRDEVQKTTTSEVLSIRMVKKTEQIEKLAKELKNKAKAG